MKNILRNILTTAAIAGFVSGATAAPRPVIVTGTAATTATAKGQ